MDLSNAYLAATFLPLIFVTGMLSNIVRAESGLELKKFSAISICSNIGVFLSQATDTTIVISKMMRF